MDTSFERVQDAWNKVDIAMEKVEEVPMYTTESAVDLEHAVLEFWNAFNRWKNVHENPIYRMGSGEQGE